MVTSTPAALFKTVTTLYRIEHACDIDINADIHLSDVGIDIINTSSILSQDWSWSSAALFLWPLCGRLIACGSIKLTLQTWFSVLCAL